MMFVVDRRGSLRDPTILYNGVADGDIQFNFKLDHSTI